MYETTETNQPNQNNAYIHRFRISAKSAKLSEREQAVCSYIAQHGKEIIHMSITEVAEKCHISEATLVRLSKKLGYKGFQALKISVAQDCVEPVLQFHESLSKGDSVKTITQKIFRSYAQALNDTLSILDDKSVEAAAICIEKAERVMFVAAGGSEIVAEDAVNKFLRIGIPTYAYTDANMQRMMAAVLTERDVAIAISHSGTTLSTIETLAEAKDAGATTIVITNAGRSPILKYGDISLFTSSTETSYKGEALSSRIAQLALLDTLITAISYRNDELYYGNLKKIRKALVGTKI